MKKCRQRRELEVILSGNCWIVEASFGVAGVAPTVRVIKYFLLGVAQTHFIFLSWYKKTKQKKIKADVPSRPAKCLFTKRRKLAYGSDSSTFFFAHFRTSGCPSRRVGRSVLCEAQNQLRIKNYKLRILRVSESRAELVRAMPSGSKMFYEVKELRPAVRSKLRLIV